MVVTRRRNMPKAEQNGSLSRPHIKQPNKYKDVCGILLLTALYILQGIPLGLAAAVPYLLQSSQQTASYRHQAIFSWVYWPFSLKLCWAPVVDAIYFKRIGRRKSWLLPIQYALGIDFFILGGRVDRWLGRPEGDPWGPLGANGDVQIWPLTIAFFGLTLLAATQDIVVDGWALTMLSPGNVGWASTCNTVGQTIGYIVGFMLFLAIESPDVCNNYLRSVPVPGKGFISFSGFLHVCGVLFIVSTTLVAIFKREKDNSIPEPKATTLHPTNSGEDEALNNSHSPLLLTENGEMEILPHGTVATLAQMEADATPKNLSLLQTYCVMLGILRLRPVLRYIAFIFIVKFVFSAADSVFGLKILEHGVSKERMALIGSAVLPLQAILPVLVTHWSNGPRPLGVYLNAAIPRAIVAITSVLVVYYADFFKVETPVAPDLWNSSTGIPADVTISFSATFYILLITQLVAYTIFSSVMFVCQMAFHAKISDPSIGGTYMTLLNTMANMAAALPSTVMLFFVEPLTWRSCDNATVEKAITALNTTVTDPSKLIQLADKFLAKNATCINLEGINACKLAGGSCRTIMDGFYIEICVCLLVGLVSYFTILRGMARSLDALPLKAYRFRKRTSESPPPLSN
ncbi:unnamed protein product [Hymenolepis diminuta]|uniref:MFS domain-containing protein n=2 Tax=Hymenolepis diminuta TaxID=6216 RepID=A0A564YSY6_HYMDI|nr:unnamed protein product [Hymenolepis diminuta]